MSKGSYVRPFGPGGQKNFDSEYDRIFGQPEVGCKVRPATSDRRGLVIAVAGTGPDGKPDQFEVQFEDGTVEVWAASRLKRA